MAIYHKLINGKILNNYDLSLEMDEAIKIGYKPLKIVGEQTEKSYFKYVEKDDCIEKIWMEYEQQ